MPRKVHLFICLCLLGFITFSCKEAPTASTKALAKGNNRFALKLYQEIKDPQKNLFISPYSIYSALGMSYAGARNKTASEMAKVLDFSDTTHADFSILNSHILRSSGDQKVSIANALFLTGGGVKETYQELLKDTYGAEVFSGDVDDINDYAKEKTNGKIEKILDHLSPNSNFVLLNAISFKGMWSNPFEAKNTQVKSFHLSDKEIVEVPMMTDYGKYKILHHDDFKALELPFQDGISMMAFLPNEDSSLEKFEKSLNAELLGKSIADFTKNIPILSKISVPKLKLDPSYELKQTCQALGINDAFTNKADFSGAKANAYISQIAQKSYLKLDELGAEAAAVTAIELEVKSAAIFEIPEFHLNRPFFFIIIDKTNSTILFMGRILDPR